MEVVTIPALRSFRLTYPGGRDHEITLLQVLAGGVSEDLTPEAENNPSSIPDGRLDVVIQDASPSGEEFGYQVAHSALRVPSDVLGGRRFQIRDVGCVDTCVRKLPTRVFSSNGLLPQREPSIVALVGFKLFFIGATDRRLDRIGVWFNDDELHVALRDSNGNDTFGYLVDFVVIPVLGLNVSTGIERGSGTGFHTEPLPTPSRAHFLLTGWALNFQSGDNEILDLGIIKRQNDVTVFYGDAGGGEAFDWRVEWAHVAPQTATTN